MRDDVSDKLVHLSKGTGDDASKHREEAAANLFSILKGYPDLAVFEASQPSGLQ